MPQPAEPSQNNAYPHPPENLPYGEWNQLMMDFFREAGGIALKWQRRLTPSRKADKTIVTEADLEVSALAHRVFAPLKEQGHLILDEETADEAGAPSAELFASHDFIWAIDPIDGTSAYTMGFTSFAISAGLLYKGRPLIGGVLMPATNTLFIHDEQRAMQMHRPFGTNIHSEPLKMLESLDGHVFFDVVSGKPIKEFDLSDLPADITASNAMAVGLAHVASGRACGCYFQAAVWDLAGAWPLLEAVGAKVFNLETGAALEEITPDLLQETWYFKDRYIVCNPSFFSRLQAAFKTKK